VPLRDFDDEVNWCGVTASGEDRARSPAGDGSWLDSLNLFYCALEE